MSAMQILTKILPALLLLLVTVLGAAVIAQMGRHMIEILTEAGGELPFLSRWVLGWISQTSFVPLMVGVGGFASLLVLWLGLDSTRSRHCLLVSHFFWTILSLFFLLSLVAMTLPLLRMAAS